MRSVARVLSSCGLGGHADEGKVAYDVGRVRESSAKDASKPPMPAAVEGSAVMGPNPIVSVALGVLLVLRPSDVAGEDV